MREYRIVPVPATEAQQKKGAEAWDQWADKVWSNDADTVGTGMIYNTMISAAPDPAEDAEFVEALAVFFADWGERLGAVNFADRVLARKECAEALLRSPLLRGE